MKAFLKKLTSRKFLTALVGVVTGLAIAFGLDEGVITTVSGAVTAIVSVATYIISEAKVDAAAVVISETASKAVTAVDAVDAAIDAVNTVSDVSTAEVK